MEDQSFDRIARLLGGTATRRGGILAAAAAALGLSAGASFADADAGSDVDAEKRKGRCKPSARDASAGTESAVDAEKGKRTRCRKNNQCCSLICTGTRRGRRNRRHHNRKDIAVNGLMASQDDLDEAGFDEPGYEDSSAGDAGLRGLAAASDVETEKHRRRGRNRRRCRCRRAGATCNVDVNCCNGRACVNGKCTGKSKNVPTGESCDAGNDTCRNHAAICTQYADKRPGGPYCLIPDGKACSGNSQCVSENCKNGVCKRGAGGGGGGCTSNADCIAQGADTCTAGVCTCGSAPACSSSATPICCAGACMAGTWTNQTNVPVAGFPMGMSVTRDGLTAAIANGGTYKIDLFTRSAADSIDWTAQPSLETDLDPVGVDFSKDGLSLLLARNSDDAIKVYTRPSTTSNSWTPQTTFGGGPPGSGPAEFDTPDGVWLSDNGLTALVADRDNDRVSVWTRTTATGTDWTHQTNFGTSGSGPDQINWDQSVTLSGDGLTALVAEQDNARISVWRRSAANGTDWTHQVNFGDSSSTTPVGVTYGVWVATDGLTAIVTEFNNAKVSIWTRTTPDGTDWTQQTSFGTSGSGDNQFGTPQGIAMTGDWMTILATDNTNKRMSVWRRVCPA